RPRPPGRCHIVGTGGRRGAGSAGSSRARRGPYGPAAPHDLCLPHLSPGHRGRPGGPRLWVTASLLGRAEAHVLPALEAVAVVGTDAGELEHSHAGGPVRLHR